LRPGKQNRRLPKTQTTRQRKEPTKIFGVLSASPKRGIRDPRFSF